MPGVEFVLFGQPCSKANSRKIVLIGKRPSVIKSEEALMYEAMALKQIPPKVRVRLEGPVSITMRIFYESERPDLDESLILDVLQDRWKRPAPTTAQERAGVVPDRVLIQAGVYRNDRQVREKHVFHGIDRLRPRTEIRVEPMHEQGTLL